MKNIILILLFIPMLILSSCSTSLDNKLLEMNSEELLEYSKSHYQQYNKSGLEMVEMERLQKTGIILDGLLLTDNINWEDLQFEDPEFKDKLKTRSSELSNSDGFTRIQFSYKKIKENPDISDVDLELSYKCEGKTKDIERLESDRLNKFSDLSFNIKSVEYIDNCTYQVLSYVRDQMNMTTFDLKNKYIFDSSSGKFVITEEGEILNKKRIRVSESDVQKSLNRYIKNNRLLHSYPGGMSFFPNMSNTNQGLYVYYGAICYGSSKNNCRMQSGYMITKDYGKTWTSELRFR